MPCVDPRPVPSQRASAPRYRRPPRSAGTRSIPRSRRAGHPRAPQHCTVGYGYYPDSHQRIPTLRLRGRWLEQLGFTIGSRLHISMRNGELVVSVADDGEKATDKAANNWR
ncbi:SymE family type I addiction module toxin [Xanthomonas perforans]|uniref:SymE family type I addiction module toxin n=1 Tax=Xanthomonas perforans TaxID=442694 RepID=UPI003CCF464E